MKESLPRKKDFEGIYWVAREREMFMWTSHYIICTSINWQHAHYYKLQQKKGTVHWRVYMQKKMTMNF